MTSTLSPSSAVSDVPTDAPAGFRVTLDDFDGPFDLLLSLITKRELDITEVSLSVVTDEFLSYLRALDTGDGYDSDGLDQASEFLVVAVTLLDLKIASLLPQGEPLTFRQLIAGAEIKGVIVARFLALLELYRNAAVGFEQLEPLGELTVRWTAENWNDENLVNLGADYGQ